MMQLLTTLFIWVLSGMIARMLLGAGLTVLTFSLAYPYVEQLLNYGADALSSVPSAILQLALLTGIGEFITIVGSALLTRAAIKAASVGMGIATPSV